MKMTLRIPPPKKKGLPSSSTFRKCPYDKLTIYFAWPNLKSGQKTKWPNIVDRSVYRMKDMDPIKIFLFDYSRHKIFSLLLDLGPTPPLLPHPVAPPRGGLGGTRPPQSFSRPFIQFVQIRGENFEKKVQPPPFNTTLSASLV